MNEKSLFLKDCKGFTKVSNKLLRSDLSITAIGLMAKLLSYNDFAIHKATEQRKSGLGEKAFNNAWAELEDHGFIKRERIGTGKFVYRWVIINEPGRHAIEDGNKQEKQTTTTSVNSEATNQGSYSTPGNPGLENQDWNTRDGKGASNIDASNQDNKKENKSKKETDNTDIDDLDQDLADIGIRIISL